MDMVSTLKCIGVDEIFLPEELIAGSIQHDDDLRFQHTGGKSHLHNSFLPNLIYREFKRNMIGLMGIEKFNALRSKTFEQAKLAASKFRQQENVSVEALITERLVPLGAAIGIPDLKIGVSLKIILSR